MSSNRYAEKSEEEVKQLLKNYCEQYHKQFESDPDLVALKLKLNEIATKKKEELFHRTFLELSPKTLRDICKVIDDSMGFSQVPTIEDVQPAKKQKKKG